MFNRTHLAYLISPLFPALYLLLLPFFLGASYTGRYDMLLVLVFALPVSYISCLAFGIPLISFLRKKNSLNIINLVTAGAILGLIVFYMFGFGFAELLNSTKKPVPDLKELLHGAMFGILVSLPFSLIAGIPFLNTKN